MRFLRTFSTAVRELFTSPYSANVLVLLLTWTLFRFIFSGIDTYLSLYYRALGATAQDIGIATAISTAATVLTLIVGSTVADYYGRRRLVVVMTYVLAVPFLLCALAQSWVHLMIAYAIYSVVVGVYRPALQAVFADSLPPSVRGLGFSLSWALPSLAAIVGPILAALLVSHLQLVPALRLLYLLAVLITLTCALLRHLLLRETYETSRRGLTVRDLVNLYAESFRNLVRIWYSLDRTVLVLMVLPILGSVGAVFYRSFSVLYAVDYIGLTKVEWGFLTSYHFLLLALLSIVLGRLVDVFGRRRCLILARTLTLVELVLFLNARSWLHVLLAWTIGAVGEALAYPAVQSLLTDHTPKELRGRVYGTREIIMDLSFAATAPLVGYLYGVDLTLLLVLLYVTSVLSLLLILLFTEEAVRREV